MACLQNMVPEYIIQVTLILYSYLKAWGLCGADGVLTLEVQDDGPGVPAGEERLIFEPFERGAGNGESGVGLGLALARDLARSLGGDLKLVGAAGGGACFRLTLPGLLRTEHSSVAEMPQHDARPAR